MTSTHAFEVIVPLAVWRQSMMPLLANPQVVATGRLLRDPSRHPTGLLVDSLTAGARPRTGKDFAPLADWLAVGAPRGTPPETPESWIRRLEPRFAQMLVIVLVGFGRGRDVWRGWTVERGMVSTLAGLRIIGPGMVHAEADPSPELDLEELEGRWSRVRGAVGEAAFAKLRQAKVAVIGCSRIGTLAAGMLAALGVRALVLMDGDVVEPHNLDGMLLCTDTDLGANKAIALGRRLVAFRSSLMVKAVDRPLNSRLSESALGGADLIVTCVDQDGGRLRAAHWAREHLVPHLDLGTGVTRTPTAERQLAADVRLLLPGAGCIRCVGGLADLEQAEYELHAPSGALPRRPPEPWNARGRLGSLITLNSLAVSFGIQSWLDLLDGSLAGSIWHRLRWRVGRGLEIDSGLVGAGTRCLLCRSSPQIA